MFLPNMNSSLTCHELYIPALASFDLCNDVEYPSVQDVGICGTKHKVYHFSFRIFHHLILNHMFSWRQCPVRKSFVSSYLLFTRATSRLLRPLIRSSMLGSRPQGLSGSAGVESKVRNRGCIMQICGLFILLKVGGTIRFQRYLHTQHLRILSSYGTAKSGHKDFWDLSREQLLIGALTGVLGSVGVKKTSKVGLLRLDIICRFLQRSTFDSWHWSLSWCS